MKKNIQNHKHSILKNRTMRYLWYLNLIRISLMYFSSKEKKKNRKYLLYGVYNLNFWLLRLEQAFHIKFTILK